MTKSITWSGIGIWAAFAAYGCDMMEIPHQDAGDPTVTSFDYLSQLPACTTSRLNQVFFVKSVNQFFFCDGKKFQQVDLAPIVDKDGKTLVTTADAPPDQCPTGGVLIQIGFDANRNGKLDAAEIKSTAKVCNGATGPQGPEGPRGASGPDGGACDLVDNGDGTGTITCADGKSLTVILGGGVNHAPTAHDDNYSVNEDAVLTVPAPGVLGNDIDLDNDPLTALVASGQGTANGNLVFNPDGSFTYTPKADFSGTDSFTYTLSDGSGATATATVTITVKAINDAPISFDDAYSTNEDVTLNVPAPGVLSNDLDPNNDALFCVLENSQVPQHGTVVLSPDGHFEYSPNANFSGTDTFGYRARDASLSSAVATVTITVRPVNDAPLAVNDTFTITEDTLLAPAAPGLLSNDVDIEGDPLTVDLPQVNPRPTSHGTVDVHADGSFVYSPEVNFSGTDTFSYTVNDGTLSSSPATVTIVVNPETP